MSSLDDTGEGGSSTMGRGFEATREEGREGGGLLQRIIGGKSWVERDSWGSKIVLTREHATSFDRV